MFLLLALASNQAGAQQTSGAHVAVLGMHGGVTTPDARFGADGEINVATSFMPEQYAILTDKAAPASEYMINFSMMFLPFMEASAHIIRPANIQEHFFGIGDRSYKIRFKLLNERSYLPALALGIHDPIATNTRQGAVYLVGSKQLELRSSMLADLSLGYAFDLKDPFWEQTKLFQKVSNNNQSHLNGWFGSAKLNYKAHVLLFDYDTERFNAGYSVLILKKIRAGVYTLGFNELTYQIGICHIFGQPLIRELNNHGNIFK